MDQVKKPSKSPVKPDLKSSRAKPATSTVKERPAEQATGFKRLVDATFNSMAAIRFGLKREPALRQELVLFAVSLVIGPLLTLDPWKLVAMWATLLLLLAVEFLNTGLEKLADKVTLATDDLVRIAKDCGSAAVLMTILIAGMVWSLALWERLSGL